MKGLGTFAKKNALKKKTALSILPVKRMILCAFLCAAAIFALVLVIRDANWTNKGSEIVGENTIAVRPSEGTPEDCDAIENLFIAAGVLKEAGSFRASCEGTTVSMGITQPIRSERAVVGNRAFKEVVSCGVVKMAEQRYYTGNDYLIRFGKANTVTDVVWGNTSDDVRAYTAQGHEEEYGYVPNEMTSYILNRESVNSGALVSAANGLYTYEYDLNVERAPSRLLREMSHSAGTGKKYPQFEVAKLTVVMDGNWVVRSATTYSRYQVAMFGGIGCEENMTETFRDVGNVTELPQTDFFTPYFGAVASDDVAKEPDAISLLAEMFAETASGTPLNADLAVMSPNGDSLLSGKIRLELDIKNLDNIRADVLLGSSENGLSVHYGNGKVLLGYGDFRGSLKVADVTDAVKQLTALFGGKTDPSDGSDAPADPTEAKKDALDLDELLKYELTDGGCDVSLALELGDISVEAHIYGEKDEATDSYKFASIEASVGGYALRVLPSAEWEARDLASETCPDLMGLFDVMKDGVVELTADVADVTADVRLDLKEKTLHAVCGELSLVYADNTVYVAFRDAKLKLAVADVGKLTEKLQPLLASFGLDEKIADLIGGLSETEFDLRSLLGGLDFVATDESVTLSCALFGGNVAVDLNVVAGKWTLGGLRGSFGDLSFGVRPSHMETLPVIDPSVCIDLAEVADTYLGALQNLIDAKGYSGKAHLDLTLGGKAVAVDVAVQWMNGIAVQGSVSVDSLTVAVFDVAVADGVVYATVNGVDIAVRIGASNTTTSAETVLRALLGYNKTLDGVVNEILRVIGEAKSGVDYVGLFGGLRFENGVLTATVNGAPFTLPDLTVSLTGGKTLGIEIPTYAFGGITLAVNAEIMPYDKPVVAPTRSYVTNLDVRIDELNTVHVRLDFLRGTYSFRLDDLFGEVADNTVLLAYKDLRIRGDIAEIMQIIDQLKVILEEAKQRYALGFAGEIVTNAPTSDLLGDLLRSLTFVSDAENNRFSIACRVLGLNATLAVDCGESPRMQVILPLLGKEITVTAGGEAEYFDFASVAAEEYLNISDVFADYFDEIAALVAANSWHFDLSANITLGDKQYRLADGSALDFVYYTSDKYDLKATVNLQKWDGKGFVDAIRLVAAYVDGRIYVDYSDASNNGTVKTDNHLKVTVSADAIARCADLAPRLLEVVPQLADLLTALKQSMADASQNMELVRYSTVLRSASYVDGNLQLTVNGGVILPALGDIDLVIGKRADGGLALTVNSLTYDDGKENGTKLSVTELSAGVIAQTEDAGKTAIGAWSTDGWINLDSLYELLSAFVQTANSKSFHIEGTVQVKLVVEMTVDIDLQVDIDDDGFVYVAVRIYRPKIDSGVDLKNMAFNDRGGYSYLLFDGKNGTFRVLRDSYESYTYCSYKSCNNWTCTNGWHTGWHKSHVKLNSEMGYAPEYDSGVLTTEQFTGDIFGYLMKMINFKSWIEDQISGAIAKENTREYGFEDLIKNYSYADRTFSVHVDLNPMNKDLNEIKINIAHDEEFNITSLTGSMGLLGGMCTITIERMELLAPSYGVATDYVQNVTLWK